MRIKLTGRYEACIEIDTSENSDWGYARNKQVLLKNVLLEYSTSTFDAPVPSPLGALHGGNRDFSWQGLLVGPVGGELHKLLDALYYKPLDAEELRPVLVKAWRDSANYVYVDEEGELYEVSISVSTGKRVGVLAARASRPSIFAPILDMRRAESTESPSYDVRAEDGRLDVSSSSTPLKLSISGFDEAQKVELALDWVYKLGDGFRTIEEGRVAFVRHTRRVYIPVALISSRGAVRAEVPLPEAKYRGLEVDVDKKAKVAELLNAPPRILDAILLRIDRLIGFGSPINRLIAPEAGAMWFKKVWASDLLEGLRWNVRTYLEGLGLSKWLTSLVRELVRLAYEMKGLRVLVNRGEYSSIALPQLVNVSSYVGEATGDVGVVKDAYKLAVMTCKALKAGEEFSGCRLHEGLILCKANSSWIDVVYPTEDGGRWPTRLPWGWRGRAPHDGQFALVEVNALFIEALGSLAKASKKVGLEVREELVELREELLEGYRKWFAAKGGLPPMTVEPTAGLVDSTKSSMGVLALAVLKDTLYSREELEEAWGDVEQLLVRRRLIKLGDGWEVFGVLTRRGEAKPYLGDLEYHGAVVWPRDTPYLIELMRALSMNAYGVLVNNLDHMVSEGAIGYVNELFSLPIGENPSPGGEEPLNPVPVKNYAQYWSHWCDPYLDYFKKGAEGL
ncbi:MAG: hypothetical protein N3H31_06825 [Candidatus Nezhaarchaeota archaeon]|nr:hypothetical protein [Candidatus Nezhaarchaeota archaeon]